MVLHCTFGAMSFQETLIHWYNLNKRDLPWRNQTDAYIIWLSEVIMQQTRVEQGLPYFLRFAEHFPTVVDFSQASEDQVLKLWQGLGYYSRGRNMLTTAKQIVEEFDGVFPTSYRKLISLKGIGEYTAAAISSFSSNENRAVVDGNVFRVLARYFGIEEPTNSSSGKKIFSSLAQDLISDQEAIIYNQAIMEFGALQCKPKAPKCEVCPLSLSCYALKEGKVELLPKKNKLKKIRERWFNYLVVSDGFEVAINQRVEGDIWQSLYDFPLIETDGPVEGMEEVFLTQVRSWFGDQTEIRLVSRKKHILSHQIIYVHFFVLENYMINFSLHANIKSATLADFKALPHPKVVGDFVNMYL